MSFIRQAVEATFPEMVTVNREDAIAHILKVARRSKLKPKVVPIGTDGIQLTMPVEAGGDRALKMADKLFQIVYQTFEEMGAPEPDMQKSLGATSATVIVKPYDNKGQLRPRTMQFESTGSFISRAVLEANPWHDPATGRLGFGKKGTAVWSFKYKTMAKRRAKKTSGSGRLTFISKACGRDPGSERCRDVAGIPA